MMAVVRVASHNSSSQKRLESEGYELAAFRQNTYWQRATSQEQQLLHRQINTKRYT